MTEYSYVTSTSRGIGRAPVEMLAEGQGVRVTGLGRNAGPMLHNCLQVRLDLGDLDAVAAYRFPHTPTRLASSWSTTPPSSLPPTWLRRPATRYGRRPRSTLSGRWWWF